MEAITTILDDKRPIAFIQFNDQQQLCVGVDGVTKIEAYGEPSEHCYVPWFAVYRGEELWMRVPAGHVEVLYAD